MSKESKRTAYLAGRLPADRPRATEEASAPATRKAPLRRWSVAELLARALAAPPVDRMSH